MNSRPARDPRPTSASRHAADAGFTLVEVVISASLLIAMLYAVSTLSLSGAQAADLSRRLTRASEVTQEIVDDMRLELTSSVRLFGNDTEGIECMQRFDISGGPPPLGSLRLPTIDSGGSVRADTPGDEITGNVLIFAKLAWTDRFVCTSSAEYLVDVTRWVGYYLTPEAGGPMEGRPTGLNLVRVLSEPLIDAAGIDSITDSTDQAEFLLHLLNATPDAQGVRHAPCEIVWQRGALPSTVGTFRQIDPTNGSLSFTPILATGRADPFAVERAEPDLTGILYYRHHSVATNYSQPSYGVGAFAVMDSAGDGFPHGFEVQIAGPSSARQVLLHLVVTSTNGTGHLAWSNVQVLVDARDI
ncbi:MAG: hypothetical protein KDC98_08555 [Planctomycetes bacterium]|nr:hypothetical protein [Planctomycetota bacterium]